MDESQYQFEISNLDRENRELKSQVEELKDKVSDLEDRNQRIVDDIYDLYRKY